VLYLLVFIEFWDLIDNCLSSVNVLRLFPVTYSFQSYNYQHGSVNKFIYSLLFWWCNVYHACQMEPRFAGSHLAKSDGLLRAIKIHSTTSCRGGSKAIEPML
jgi:hypothetical protein